MIKNKFNIFNKLGIYHKALILILFFIFLLGIYRDIRNLQGAMSVASGGDFKSRIPVRRRDEIGELAVSFNCMMDKLYEYQQKVNNYQTELEKKEEMQLQLINKLITSRENERRRISLELYNQIGQFYPA